MPSPPKKEEKEEEIPIEEIPVEVISSAEEIEALRPEKEKLRERAAVCIALVLVVGFLALLFFPFIYLFTTSGATVADAIDLIKTVSAVLSGTIGAVLGYYFRIVQEER